MVSAYGLPGGVKCYNTTFEGITGKMTSIFDTYERKKLLARPDVMGFVSSFNLEMICAIFFFIRSEMMISSFIIYILY